MTSESLIAHRRQSARIAVRDGESISAGCFLAAVQTLASQLPPAQYVLNTCHDRYHFAVAFCAALVAGRTSLLPPSRTPETLARLAARYPDTLYIGEEAADIVWHNAALPKAKWRPDANQSVWPPPSIDRDRVAAIAFTSGSTGEPQPQPKIWGGIVDGARAEIVALQFDDGGEALDDVVLVGTVSPQHMYGFESTVMLALQGPCAFAAEHPLHSDEVAAVLSRTSGRRVLITAPVHLRALVESAHSLPTLDRVVSATAPLSSELAQRCESIWHTRVFEVYGCTETGMVATRRTVDGAQWKTMRDVKIERTGEGFRAHGGHVQPGMLADRLRLIDDSTFELEGRADDIVNIGGKRASLQGLNRALLSIDGVVDGAIFEPPNAPTTTREQRLMGLVVAPHLTRAQLLAALRAQVDPVFLPRPLLWVDALPRNAQGKLPRAELLCWPSKRCVDLRSAAPRQTTPFPERWVRCDSGTLMRNRTISRASSTEASNHGMVKADHPMLVGHFPGRPIVPGAWLLAWVVATATRQLAAVETRSIAAIKRVKFLRPLAPDQRFDCALSLRDSGVEAPPGGLDTMRFEVTSHGDVIAEGSLLLKSVVIDPAR